MVKQTIIKSNSSFERLILRKSINLFAKMHIICKNFSIRNHSKVNTRTSTNVRRMTESVTKVNEQEEKLIQGELRSQK